jgi:hypothetical protein
MRTPAQPVALSIAALLFTLLAAASAPRPAAALVIVGGLDVDPGDRGSSVEVVGTRAYLGTGSRGQIVERPDFLTI